MRCLWILPMIQTLQTFVCLVSRRLVEKQLAVIHFTDKQLTKDRLFRLLLKWIFCELICFEQSTYLRYPWYNPRIYCSKTKVCQYHIANTRLKYITSTVLRRYHDDTGYRILMTLDILAILNDTKPYQVCMQFVLNENEFCTKIRYTQGSQIMIIPKQPLSLLWDSGNPPL